MRVFFYFERKCFNKYNYAILISKKNFLIAIKYLMCILVIKNYTYRLFMDFMRIKILFKKNWNGYYARFEKRPFIFKTILKIYTVYLKRVS